MTTTLLTETHHLVSRYLSIRHPDVTLDPLPPNAPTHHHLVALTLRPPHRGHVTTIGHDELGWWVRVRVGPASSHPSLYSALRAAVAVCMEPTP